MSKTWPLIEFDKAKKPHYPSVKYWSDKLSRYVFVRLAEKSEFDYPDLQEFNDWEDYVVTQDDLIYPDRSPLEMEIYNPAIHDSKHLMCPDIGCHAPMIHIDENQERVEHWKAYNNLYHQEDCRYRHHDFDKDKGFKVSVEMKGLSSPSSPATMMDNLREKYSRDQEKHPKFAKAQKAFEGMEKFQAKGVQDIIRLYQKAGVQRNLSSIFKNSGQYYTEAQFLIRRPMAGEENRYQNLYDRLIAMPHGNYLPVAMQFHMRHEHGRGNSHGTVASQAIFLHRELGDTGQDGIVHFMVPRAKPAAGKDLNLAKVFNTAGDRLVYGPAVLSDVIDRGDKVFHYVDIEIHDVQRQIAKVEMSDFVEALQARPGPQTVFPFKLP